MNQNRAPIYEALVIFRQMRVVPFDTVVNSCGHCDKRCPFHTAQSEKMKETDAYFRW